MHVGNGNFVMLEQSRVRYFDLYNEIELRTNHVIHFHLLLSKRADFQVFFSLASLFISSLKLASLDSPESNMFLNPMQPKKGQTK